MKKLFTSHLFFLLLLSLGLSVNQAKADGGLVAFYNVGQLAGEIEDVATVVKSTLESSSFEIIGEYHPGKDKKLYVIAFSRKDLQDITVNIGPKGIMASVLRVGLIKQPNDSVSVFMLNPEYLFYSYLGRDINLYEADLIDISLDAKASLKTGLRQPFMPFITGSLTESELKYFRFMANKASFEEHIELKEFRSFESGLRTIKKNLRSRKGQTYGVYELIIRDKKVAVFGVGVQNTSRGEPKFLETLGPDHLAALPYELLLIDNKAVMLPGEFRFPLYWPDLTIRDFSKLRSIPTYIEDLLKSLTE